ncbi:hypothetical protein O3P69_014533 [Scylla paramamosain]|uniref:Uncharacterized protein n=1 Tax=Scylla paramamosain TaxID=85552 RepID=A0AAW0TEQ4_SCYPA
MRLVIQTLLSLLLSAEFVWMNTKIHPSGSYDWFHRTSRALEAVLSQTSNTEMTLVALTDGGIPHHSIELPYTTEDSLPMKVATWNPRKGLVLASHLTLFPEKYHRFPTAPHLTVTVELLPHHTFSWTEDLAAPGGRRLVFTGTMDKTVRYFSKAMNFTYTYVRSPEKTFGTRLPDGYWTGMMGMVVREEADFGTGPFILNKARYDAGDVTSTIWMDNMRIVSGMGSPEVDPWGFLFPLRPMVWMALITALFGIMAVTELLSLFSFNVHTTTNAFSVVRILLQQDEYTCDKKWAWERLVLGLWMLTTLVLTKSYAGNLMSLLAVKYVPQPFQTLRDVLDNNEIISIWQRYSSNEQFLREVQSGIYYEVAMLEKEGRLKFRTQGEFPESLRTLVRPGHHILIDAGVTVRNLIAQQFSMTGRCDYFRSKHGFLPFSAVVATQRNNPLVISLDKRVHELMESGLFRYWFRTAIPNSSTCDNPPRRFLETTPLAATNLWGDVRGAKTSYGGVRQPMEDSGTQPSRAKWRTSRRQPRGYVRSAGWRVDNGRHIRVCGILCCRCSASTLNCSTSSLIRSTKCSSRHPT